MMMMIVMTTGVAMAANKVEYGKHDDKAYTKTYIGAASKFTARTAYNKVYSTIENTRNEKKYMTCYTREYKVNIGWTNYDGKAGDVLPGIQVNATLNRNVNLVGYYYHLGRCAYNNYNAQAQDSYEYTAYQWYYKR